MEILCFFDNSGLHLCYQASQRLSAVRLLPLSSEAVIPRAMLACTRLGRVSRPSIRLRAVLRAGIRALARS